MWFILGILAISATFLNLYFYKTNKNYQLVMVIGLSFTALTCVAIFSDFSELIENEDWTSVADVMPTMSMVLWILVLFSIFLNILPVFLEFRNKKK